MDVSARNGNNINDMFMQMSKLIFIYKNKIMENEDKSSSENNFKILGVSKKDSKKV